MKKSSLFIIAVIVIALLFGAWKVYNGVYFDKKKLALTIKCHYVSYACGDCYPQWHIDSGFAVEKDMKDLIGKDLYVMYKGKQFEESLPDSVGKCMICYDFYFTGFLKKTLSDKHKFEADTFQIKMEKPDCCN